MRFYTTAVAALALASRALALPTSKRSVSALSSSSLQGFAPFTQFARATYCGADKLKDWNCGEACKANPTFEPSLVGGDGNAIQTFFVGYWPDQESIVVGHEGTDPVALKSDLTDIDFFLDNLDTTLFPGVKSSVKAHNGFLEEHAKTAPQILTEVKNQIAKTGAKQVITVGHSLGGALAQLDSLFFTLNLPSSVHVKSVTYGTPRVGNSDYAALFDSMVSDFVRINNEHDLIPIVPGRFLGFQHPHGEVHIVSPGDAVSCSGDDDSSDEQCTIKTVPNILKGNILNHLGPYEGISLGTIFCT